MMQQPGESISGHDASLELLTQHVVSQSLFWKQTARRQEQLIFSDFPLWQREGAGRIPPFPKENSSLCYDTTSRPAHFPPC